MLTAGEVLLQSRLPQGFNFRLMDYPFGLSSTSFGIINGHRQGRVWCM